MANVTIQQLPGNSALTGAELIPLWQVANTAQASINLFFSSIKANVNVANLNVVQNIANTGNLLVTQNIAVGNVAIAQNVSYGNGSGSNLALTQNASAGNLSIANANVTATLNVLNIALQGNIVSGLSGANIPLGIYALNTTNLTVTVQANGEVSIDTNVTQVGGSNSQIQFNKNNAFFRGTPNLTFNIAANVMTVGSGPSININANVGNTNPYGFGVGSGANGTTFFMPANNQLSIGINANSVMNVTQTSINVAYVLNVATNLVAANAAVNSISFFPAWTNLTTNNAGNLPNGPNNWTGVSTGWDTAGFWTDPFGMVHLRGLLANSGTGNTSMANLQVGFNIANGFPAPTTNATFLIAARANGNGAGNVVSAVLTVYNNGAAQLINVVFSNGAPLVATTSWNIANLSLYGHTYSIF